MSEEVIIRKNYQRPLHVYYVKEAKQRSVPIEEGPVPKEEEGSGFQTRLKDGHTRQRVGGRNTGGKCSTPPIFAMWVSLSRLVPDSHFLSPLSLSPLGKGNVLIK